MNIKTITCHDVYNYGASLQAYALQTFLVNKGHVVEIIDYLPDYKERRYQWFSIPKGSKWENVVRYLPFMRPFLGLWCNRNDIKYFQRKNRFDEFKKINLHCTDAQYHNIKELVDNTPLSDLYIAGSDQIWNTKYINGTDPSFYCDFVGDQSKCISYAASFATSELATQWKEFVKSKLANFKAISVREKTGVSIANSLGYEATNVLDPVFLLDKNDWTSMCNASHSERYLLVYEFLHNDPKFKTLVIKEANRRNLKIYSINDGGRCTYAHKNIYDAGPIQFLEWIQNAELVISNSFHATAFSVIFERDFFTLPLKGHKNSSRMTDFLDSIGLLNRFVSDASLAPIQSIDYAIVNARLCDLQARSRRWLLNYC